MIYVYDKVKNIYWELDYVNPEALAEMEKDPSLWFIKESNDIFSKIQNIQPAFRRFIRIDNGKVEIDSIALKKDILLQLEDRKKERLSYLDSELNSITQKLALEENIADRDELKKEAKSLLQEKEKWSNLENNAAFEDLIKLNNYSDIVNAILKDVDPTFVEPLSEQQINTLN